MKSLQLFLFLFTASGLTGIAAPAPAPKVAVAAFTFHTFSVFEAVERTAQAGAHYLETFTNQTLSPTDPTKIYATSGVVPLEAIKMLAGRINSVHLKERAEIGSRTPDLVYGTGITATVDIIAELRRQKFDGFLVIEYEVNPRNNLAEVKQCVEFLRQHLKTQ